MGKRREQEGDGWQDHVEPLRPFKGFDFERKKVRSGKVLTPGLMF